MATLPSTPLDLPALWERAGTLNEPVHQEPLAGGAVQLLHRGTGGAALVVEAPEYLLCYLCLLGSRSATVLIEADIKPIVYPRVELVVLVAYLPVRESLLDCLGLRAGAVLVSAADIEDVVATQATEPSEYVNT